MTEREANFDGLVGPTHSYAGLSHGNVASKKNVGRTSSPRGAALQGLAKMRALHRLGLVQGVIPPHERPFVPALRRLGFHGSDHEVIHRAAKSDEALLAIASSASAMWTANAATVGPSADTSDGRVHFVVANLENRAHRAFEAPQTARTLRAIFRDARRFSVHDALPGGQGFGDEGAANHTRLVGRDGRATHFFVHGRRALGTAPIPSRFPARQTLEASEAVARLLHLDAARVVHAQQSPDAIDAGVFHNDVIAVGHGTLLFAHEHAFLERERVLAALRAGVEGFELFEVKGDELAVEEAVSTYLFNSQILTLPQGKRVLVAPEETRASPRAHAVVERAIAEGALAAVHYFDLRESMQNGGGPACLRLRVALREADLAGVAPGCVLDEPKIDALEAWVRAHYRDALAPEDLADPKLLDESRTALDALTQLLGLGSIYPFQRDAGEL
jgi:succinylarginine dihydrolase